MFEGLNLEKLTKDLNKQLEDVQKVANNKRNDFIKLSSWYVDKNDIVAFTNNEVKLRNGNTIFFDDLSKEQIYKLLK